MRNSSRPIAPGLALPETWGFYLGQIRFALHLHLFGSNLRRLKPESKTSLVCSAWLSNPNVATPKKLVYYFGYREKTRAKALSQLRKDHPEMSDTEFRSNYQYLDGEAYIEARFASGKLNNLASSKSETY